MHKLLKDGDQTANGVVKDKCRFVIATANMSIHFLFLFFLRSVICLVRLADICCYVINVRSVIYVKTLFF